MDLTVKGNISTGIAPHADFRSKWCMEGQKLKNNISGRSRHPILQRL